MNKPFANAFQFATFIATLFFFLGTSIPDASAQRHLCAKAGAGCGSATGTTEEVVEEQTEEEAAEAEEVEDVIPDPPTSGNVSWSFLGNLTSSSAVTTTSDSSSSKTSRPDVNRTETKNKRRGSSYTRTGSIEFDSDEDYRRSCVWIPTEIPLYRKIIRIYYTLKFDSDRENENGDGTVLAFLPGSTSVSSSLCGGYGEYLGFGDRSGYTAMPEPRFGVEVDTAKTTSLSDPDNNHMAIVGEGVTHNGTLAPTCPATSAANDDTSPYGACWTGASTTYRSRHHGYSRTYPWLETGSTHKIRVEMLACAGSGSTNNCVSKGCAATDVYVKAWTCAYGNTSCYNSSSFQGLESAYSGSASATIEKCVPFSQTTYDSLIVGFTYGTGDHNSETRYGSFALKTFDGP